MKTALKSYPLGADGTRTVLYLNLTEVEGTLNAKPLGYISGDAAEPHLVTPRILPMGCYDSLLMEALYDSQQWKLSQVLTWNI